MGFANCFLKIYEPGSKCLEDFGNFAKTRVALMAVRLNSRSEENFLVKCSEVNILGAISDELHQGSQSASPLTPQTKTKSAVNLSVINEQ